MGVSSTPSKGPVRPRGYRWRRALACSVKGGSVEVVEEDEGRMGPPIRPRLTGALVAGGCARGGAVGAGDSGLLTS